MDSRTESTGRDNTRGHSNEEGYGRTSSITGADLTNPPKDIQNLPDVDKRFLAGMLREGVAQGLETCQRGTSVGRDRASQLRFADKWIAGNVPFLAGVIGDVDTGGSSRG